MKRDMALICQILKYVEQHGSPVDRALEAPEIPGKEAAEVEYHIGLCEEAGFIAARRTSAGVFPQRLTWLGHEKLEELRSKR